MNLHRPLCCCRVAVRWGLVVATLAGCSLSGGWKRDDASAVALCRDQVQRGRTALERGDAAAAEQMFAAAVQASPLDAEAHRYYAESLWLQGENARAGEQFRLAIAATPDDSQLRVRCGTLYRQQGDLAAARAEANAAIRQAPELASAWMLRAEVALALGQPQEALADLHRCLSSAPDHQPALLSAADIYLELGQPRRALITLDRLQQVYLPGEEPPPVLERVGRAYLALERGPDAVERLSAAVARGPASAQLWYLLAEAERLSGHAALAQQHAERALALDPQHAPSMAIARGTGVTAADALRR